MKNYDMELAVVAGMMQDNSRIQEVDLLPEEFAFEIPRSIYSAIQDLTAQRIPADVITVAEYMTTTSHVGDDWFSQIAHIVSNVVGVNVKAYSERVRELATKRKAAQIAHALMDTAEEGQSAVDEAIRALMDLGRTKRKYEYTIKETLRGALDEIEENLEKGELSGVPSGIGDIDNILGGFHNTDLVVIGARPAMGKTAMLLNCLLGADCSVGLISAEQGHQQIGTRIIAIDGLVNAQDMRRASRLDDSQFARISASVARLMPRNIHINDMPAPTLQDIQRQARKWKFRNDIKALYVDYIQRVKGNAKLPRHEQVAEIAMGLKELARELEIPVIALAQVNRQVEARANKRPMMSDLKDSGAVEQEADVIMTLYRDEVYDESTPDKGIIEIGIQKNRHGVTGIIRAAWRGEYLKISELEEHR